MGFSCSSGVCTAKREAFLYNEVLGLSSAAVVILLILSYSL